MKKHPFKDKLIAFVGTPGNCTRREVYDEVIAIGGIIEDNINTFLHYVVAFNGAEKTVKYKKASKLADKGLLAIINESQFFDILEGKADAPEIPKLAEGA
jgi:NAD-dependent DNA ligase